MVKLPHQDGWYRVPGSAQRKRHTEDDEGFYFWSYIENGLPVRICYCDDFESRPKFLNEGTNNIVAYERLWGKTILDIFLTEGCRWQHKSTGVMVHATLLRQSPMHHEEERIEYMIMKEAKERLESRVRHLYREWPFCGKGGNPTLAVKLHRSEQCIEGIWVCSCDAGKGPGAVD